MEEFLNSEYSDDSTEVDSFSNASAEERSSDDFDLPLPPPPLPRDHFGVPANHSANHIGTSYPTYTPIPLRSSNGILGIRRACFPLVNFEPASTIEISKNSQYNFQARQGALRAFPPTRAIEHRKYHVSREHSLAASKLQRQLGEEHIPQDLLAGLSSESNAETSFSHIYNPLSGNQMCLTQVNSTTHAVFTSGTLGNQLQCQSVDEAHVKDWQDSPSPAFMTPIQQLTSNDTLIGVRSFGGIAFIEMPFRLHGELPLPNTPTDFTFHPTLRRLTASVTTGLDIYLWGLGDERPELLACPFSKDPAIDHFMSNLGCVRFGSHPRSLIVGTTEEICIIDARTFTAKAQTIEIALPDRFWGFDINPTNPFQLVTSTSEALILYDLRYLQRPTLDWRHAAKALPRPNVRFIPSRALLDLECVTSWGSLQGPLVYPIDGTGMVLDPFQFPLPGSRRTPCSLGQLYPDRISEPTSLYPFGFLEDPGALTQTGCILRPTSVDAIEMFQLTEDGAVYRQVFDRVSSVEEQFQFDAIENCSVQIQPHFSPRLKADSEHPLTKTFEGSLKQILTDLSSLDQFSMSQPAFRKYSNWPLF
ncbi:hypothetical protein DSO57_1035208 [Entomophthora muscae]|uniref:Uncharacterized protein n=1 Tax=Entomophthora muscae TaxID=34485 RepID=A0ACC2REA5_9FUNG|nr:hypothetical protein DSO57_1035208 [Entomophthora muscae]